MMALSKEQQLDMYAKTKEMHRAIFGNGKKGLAEKVEDLELREAKRTGFLIAITSLITITINAVSKLWN